MYHKDGLFHMLMKIQHKVFQYNLCMLKDMNVHPGQMPLLVLLCKKDGRVQKELADQLEIKPPTLNVMIRRLEKNGLLIKKQDPEDQRKSRIYISARGRILVEEIGKKSDEIVEQVENVFTEEERKEFLRLLKKMDACMEQQIRLRSKKEEDNA